MASNKYDMPEPAVALPQRDGRVEITVVDGEIWVSDYDSDGKSNFTFVIQRGPLRGSETARAAVVDSCEKERGAEHKRRVAAARATMVGANRQLGTSATAAGQPRAAGYWYVDPNWSAHGGPVVIVEQ